MKATTKLALGMVLLAVLVGTITKARATDLFIGGNWMHLSQWDKGCPQECDTPESSVDHLGVHIEVREYFGNKHELSFLVGAGKNTNPYGCTDCWNDAGGLGAIFQLKYNYKIGSF